MKKHTKKILFTLFLGIALIFTTQFYSCEETDNVNGGDCTGCPSSAPWSKPGSGNCYATQAECEAAEGPGCVLCE